MSQLYILNSVSGNNIYLSATNSINKHSNSSMVFANIQQGKSLSLMQHCEYGSFYALASTTGGSSGHGQFETGLLHQTKETSKFQPKCSPMYPDYRGKSISAVVFWCGLRPKHCSDVMPEMAEWRETFATVQRKWHRKHNQLWGQTPWLLLWFMLI